MGVWCNGSTGDSGPPSNCSNQLTPTFFTLVCRTFYGSMIFIYS